MQAFRGQKDLTSTRMSLNKQLNLYFENFYAYLPKHTFRGYPRFMNFLQISEYWVQCIMNISSNQPLTCVNHVSLLEKFLAIEFKGVLHIFPIEYSLTHMQKLWK